MSAWDLQADRDYDYKADSIQIMADRDGCEVFEVWERNKCFRVLAHNQEEADETMDRAFYE